jgi:hypothetical protein
LHVANATKRKTSSSPDAVDAVESAIVGRVRRVVFAFCPVSTKVTVIAECQNVRFQLRISHSSESVDQADWKRHKPMCKALTSLEKNSAAAARLVSLLPKEPSSDLQEIRRLTDEQIDIYFAYLKRYIEFDLCLSLHLLKICRQTVVEHCWIQREPRCLVWSAIPVLFPGIRILNLLASARARKW